MKVCIFTLFLFCISLMFSSAAQQNKQQPTTNAATQTQTPHTTNTAPNIAPALVGIARATKYIYTHDASFTFEKEDTQPTTVVNGKNIRQAIPR